MLEGVNDNFLTLSGPTRKVLLGLFARAAHELAGASGTDIVIDLDDDPTLQCYGFGGSVTTGPSVSQ